MSEITNIIKYVTTIFKKVEALFESPKVEAIEKTVAEILPYAVEVVQDIDTFLGGNKTIEAVVALANKYGMPLANTEISGGTTALNNEIMSIAVQVLKTKVPTELQTLALNLYNSAVNLAVSLAHA